MQGIRLPWVNAGPLPGPDQADINIREPHNVAHYLLPPDGGVIRHHLVPGLHSSFGDLWPLVLAVVIGGFLLAIINGRTPVIRMLGVVALLSGIAYLFTPLTAAGPEGDPTAFTTNLRYASPAIGLGAMLLAVDPGLNDRRRDQGWLLGILAVLLLVQAVPIWDLSGHLWIRHFLLGAIGLAVFLILVPVGIVLAGTARRLTRSPGRSGGARPGPGRRDRLAEVGRLRQGSLPGIHRAEQLPGRDEECA